MKPRGKETVPLFREFTLPETAPVTRRGRIVESVVPGRICVTVDGSAPLAAENFTMAEDAVLLKPENQGMEVLLLFENGDPSLPMIAGIRKSLLQEIVREASRELPLNLEYSGRHIQMDASGDLVIRSGKSMITLTSTGHVRIEGTEIEVVATGPSRVKGSSVFLN
jgi:hypothetical protein